MRRTRSIETTQSTFFLVRLFSDKGLTRKAYLNAIAATLDYSARLLVGFMVQPILVAGLGDYFYGMWQVLNKLVGYISPASGRPAFALKWTLANQRTTADAGEKRRFVGSSIIVWVLFAPLLMALGGLLAWFAPFWLHTPDTHVWVVRLTTALLAVNLIAASLTAIPQSVLEGENLGYKRMGLSAGLVVLGGVLMWLAVAVGAGLAGVAAAALTSTFLTGLLFLQVARSYVPWFGASRPPLRTAFQFLGLSGWFLLWNLIMNLMLASDVILLGMLQSLEAVTVYALTKYAPETLISVVAIVAIGVAPGLGGIIGSGNLAKAAEVRGEIMTITALAIASMGSTILLWNRTFITLWVGPQYYAGPLPALLMVIVVSQFVLIRNDSNVIDLTLQLRHKVMLGGLSVLLSLSLAAAMLQFFRMEIIGLCLGMIAGRLILTVGYPMLVGRYLNVRGIAQLRAVVRPGLGTLCLFGLAMSLGTLAPAQAWSGVMGWFNLLLSCAATMAAAVLIAFLALLSRRQRSAIWRRFRVLVVT